MQAVKPSATLPILVLLAFTPRLFYPIQAQSTPPAPSQTAPLTSPSPPAPAPIAYDTQPLPKDPAAALQLASQANGLGSKELKPWYLKAHYQAYDAHGKPAATGVLQMWWVDQDHYRVSYASPAFTRTTFHTPEGTFQSGSTERIPYPEHFLTAVILHPIVVPQVPLPMKFESTTQSGLKMSCIRMEYSAHYHGSDCFEVNNPSLRLMEGRSSATLFNKITLFQHRFVGGEIKVFEDGEPIVAESIDDLRSFQPADTTAIEPTPDAIKKDPPVTPGAEESLWSSQSARVVPGRFVSGPDPEYPSSERGHGPQYVRLFVTVGKDGRVVSAEVVHARNPVLGAATLKAVLKFKFTPATLDGQPTEAHLYLLQTFGETR